MGADEDSVALSALTPIGFLVGGRMTMGGAWTIGVGAGGGLNPGHDRTSGDG